MIKRIIGIVKKICVLDLKEPPLIKIQLAKFSHGQGSLAQLRLYVIRHDGKRIQWTGVVKIMACNGACPIATSYVMAFSIFQALNS